MAQLSLKCHSYHIPTKFRPFCLECVGECQVLCPMSHVDCPRSGLGQVQGIFPGPGPGPALFSQLIISLPRQHSTWIFLLTIQ